MSQWQTWLPSFDTWAATYDDQVRDDPWFAYESAWAFVEGLIGEALEDPTGRTILDVGCGTGEFLRRWAERGATVIGVEPSAGMRAEARRKLPGVAILDGDLCAIPLADATADAALVTYVLSHLSAEEKLLALAELRRVVRPGGLIVVVDVAIDGSDDLQRVRRLLQETGRATQIEWYERGFAIDLRGLRELIERDDRWIEARQIGPTLWGIGWAVRGAPAG